MNSRILKVKSKKNVRKRQRYGEFVKLSFQELEAKRLTKLETKRLIALQKGLLKLGKFPEGDIKKIILYNVNFMDIVSRFQDDGYLKYQPKEKHDIMEIFNSTILSSGRQNDPVTWNSTKKREKVTIDNVVYGGIYKLPIEPARYWLNLPKSKKITIDFHSQLAVTPLSNSSIVKTRTLWITEAIVISGIESFTKNNSKLLLECTKKLLEN